MTGSGDLRVALLGYGIAGARFHGPLIEATDGLRLAAVVTADPERVATVRARHPGARVFAGADELWAAIEEFDIVVVASPNAHHAEQAERALLAGRTVVVDKPIAGTLEEAERLVAVAADAAGRLTVFQNRRWDCDFLTVRDLIDGERLGRVRRFESRMERWQPAVSDGWREDPAADAGGGVLFDLGAHVIDQAVRLFGPVASVYAEQFRGRAGARVDDDSFVALRHRCGVVSHLWVSKVSAEHDVRFRILGSRGAFTKRGIDPQEDQVGSGVPVGAPAWGVEDRSNWGTLTDGETTVTIPSRPGPYQDFYIALRDAVRSGGRMPVDPTDAVYVLRLIAAARASAEQGRVVALDDRGAQA